MKTRILRIAIILACFVLPIFFGSFALAISQPGSDPTISSIKANRYLLESGDVLIYGHYDIPYASPPGTSATDAFVFTLLDDTDVLGMITPYALMDNGYNEGIFSFYFAAADNFTWGGSYIIRVSENPIAFESPEYYDYMIPESAYTSAEDQHTNQLQLTINIIAAAQWLENNHSDYTFLDSSVSGTVLSSPTGETYFRSAIYGIQAMAPDLFIMQSYELDFEDRDWETTQFDTYESRFSETWVGTSSNETAEQFGISQSAVMGMVFILPLSIGAIILSSMKFRKAEPGFIVGSVFVIMGGLMGWIAPAIFATIYQSMGIYLAYVWFYSKG